MHRLADNNFSTFSHLSSNDPLDNEAVCHASPEALVHWLGQFIDELKEYQTQIKEKNEHLLERFVNSWELHARWEANAVVPDDRTKLPSAGESMANAFFGEKLTQRMQGLRGDQKETKSFKYSPKDRNQM